MIQQLGYTLTDRLDALTTALTTRLDLQIQHVIHDPPPRAQQQLSPQHQIRQQNPPPHQHRHQHQLPMPHQQDRQQQFLPPHPQDRQHQHRNQRQNSIVDDED